MRVALYARVSTEDQARHGISIEAQLAAMHQWAEKEGHLIVGEYVDAGISGKKPPSKRPELSRFFADVEGGVRVDLLVFCKLDRFFRSVKLYYQAVDVLDRYHVAWQAIQEDYETLTASGRMKVNIMLSVAENEADRTSERIKVVFERKIARGEWVTPSGLPLGYSMDGKKIAPDENAEAAKSVFEQYKLHGTKQAARDHLHERYGISLPILSITHMLQNPLYKGEYRGNPNFCEPIVSRELFDEVQRDLAKRASRQTPSGRVYIFSGIIRCACCGRAMGAGYSYHSGRVYYRCPNWYVYKRCNNHKTTNEKKIEAFLLEHIHDAIEEHEYKIQEKERLRQKKPIERAAVQAKLERLKDLYVDGLITKDQYRADYTKYTAQLEEAPPPKRKTGLRQVIGTDFAVVYENLSREEKKALWRSIVDHIELDADGVPSIYFSD